MTSRVQFLLIVCALAPMFAVVSATVPGCGETTTIWPCENPIFDRMTHDGRPDECCRLECCEGVITEPYPADRCVWWDAGTDGDTEEDDAGPPPGAVDDGKCPGTCIDAPALGWSEPALLWLGPAGGEIPACPKQAPVLGFEGFADLVVPPASCGTCSCTTPTATCALPSGFTASSVACNLPGGVTTSFDAPDGWDGGCTNGQAIPACSGGPCLASLTAGPLVVEGEACLTITEKPTVPAEPPTFETAARACRRGSPVTCDDPMQVCSPVAAAPPGFQVCVHQSGDAECPAAFPDKHTVATGVDDQRTCSKCACGSPSGGKCAANLTVSTDNTCAAPLLSLPIASTGRVCVDIALSGTPLGSKSVDDITYLPGTCVASGGVATGTVTATGTSTFCCMP